VGTRRTRLRGRAIVYSYRARFQRAHAAITSPHSARLASPRLRMLRAMRRRKRSRARSIGSSPIGINRRAPISLSAAGADRSYPSRWARDSPRLITRASA